MASPRFYRSTQRLRGRRLDDVPASFPIEVRPTGRLDRGRPQTDVARRSGRIVDRHRPWTRPRHVRGEELWITSATGQGSDDITVHTFGTALPTKVLAEVWCSMASRPAPQARSAEEWKRRGSFPLGNA